ncbi:MAG: hypothetical protein EXR71_16830 [Myxococcales bacterium]|nr:hypothetical protein [Myxococcales bacterium]
MKLSCGMYLDSDAFRHRMWAKFGLPRPQLHAGVAVAPYTAWLPTLDVSTAADAGRAQARFDYTAGNSWWFGFSEEGGDLECHPLTVEGLHCQLWSLNHGLVWSFSLAHGDLCPHDAKESAASIRFGPSCPEAPAEEPASRDWTTHGMVPEFYVPPPPKLRFDIPGLGAGDGPGLGDGPLPPDELPTQRQPVPL